MGTREGSMSRSPRIRQARQGLQGQGHGLGVEGQGMWVGPARLGPIGLGHHEHGQSMERWSMGRRNHQEGGTE